MCGICGQYNFEDHAPVNRRDVERMASTLVHRGPDDEGYYVSGSIGLGFRRLSIIDLAGGHQPMSNQEETVWVAFNGEIYNFPALRQELESFGYVFRTTCDTEVIVHGYSQWGEDVLNRLNGMFGLAIWDTQKRKLVVVRDPFGIKSIYYKIDHGRLLFGSEIRPLLAGANTEVEVDRTALNLFLRYRYTPAPFTIYQGIRKLAPGTKLTVEKGQCKVARWYTYQPVPFSPMKSDSEAIEELCEIYKRAVKRHLLSDVPLGLLLSGGVDSGLLLALMNLYGKSWRTYTVGYGAAFADDELKDAKETAAIFSSCHSEVLLDRSRFEHALPKIVSCLEEPIASSSIVPMYFVCERARQDVKVVLIGQGPDELFGGYRRHIGVRYAGAWGSLPHWLRGAAANAVKALPRNETLKRGVYSLDIADRTIRYQNVFSLLPGAEVDALFRDGMLPTGAGDKILECWQDFPKLSSALDDLGAFQFVELRSSLPDELLMYADKLTMAHSLEGRVPYLDKEIVEYVERLSASFKVRHGAQKWIHRRVCESFLPKSILRRKKRGFAVNVVDDWFRGAMSKKMKETLLDRESQIYRYLNPDVVGSIFAKHSSGEHDYHKILFSLVVFEEWLRVHLSPAASSVGAVC
jgi:asparagine synthase (glutamine-hydrolysing)